MTPAWSMTVTAFEALVLGAAALEEAIFGALALEAVAFKDA